MRMVLCVGLLATFASVAASAAPSEISRAFELRYIISDPKANGETDFKGETSIFTTDERVDYLTAYERFARGFFADPDWNKLVVAADEIEQTKRRLKPPPLPAVRRRLPLLDWKYLGNRPGQREAEILSLERWAREPGVEIEAGEWVLCDEGARVPVRFARQAWRFKLEWRMKTPTTGQRAAFDLDGVAEVGVDASGRYYFRTSDGLREGGPCVSEQWQRLALEVDLESGRYNFYVNDVLVADFVSVQANHAVAQLVASGSVGLRIDDMWGVGYEKSYDPDGDLHSRDVPFSIRTFIDEHFEVRPDPEGWNHPECDDRAWPRVPIWPYAHGGERHARETLYLRTRVRLGRFDRVELAAECLDPGGEVWINGRPVEVRRDRRPFSLDVTRHLRPDTDNVIAVRVDPAELERTMRHTPADQNTGWFAGRMWLDFTGRRWIKDVFVRTESLSPDAARVAVSALIRNDQVVHPAEREAKSDNTFVGKVAVSFFPWFPEESPTPVASEKFPVTIQLGRNFSWNGAMEINQPDLWFPESPRLYKVVVQLEDEQGAPLDDAVVTTGIRTVSQEGGTFRVNGRPAMMNGGLVFGFRSPLDRIAQWLRCPPEENLIREILLVKKMNGNTVRMSQHDGPAGGVNDPRYAEIGDQLGVMFQWGTTAWVRTDSPYLLDFESLPSYIRQIRNHPSIVMWQPTNHPKFPGGPAEGMAWFKQVYDTIWAEDQSRLIAPTSSLNRIRPRNDDGTMDHDGNLVSPIPAWVAPMITRGDMDHIIGYGADWSELRTYPSPAEFEGEQGWREKGFRNDYLNSPDRAYFDFESEESTAQPNWTLHQGKPEYRIRSYELDQDRSVGRRLNFEEWRQSQAWQAVGAYEAYRKKRWLDYDGMVWCTIDGGGNTATYEKPLTDYYGQAKIAFYAVKMAFQPTLAGSKNVDLAYGPDDDIPIALLHLGAARRVDVSVRVLSLQGNELAARTFRAIPVPDGRSCTDLPALRFNLPDGLYAFEYRVTSSP